MPDSRDPRSRAATVAEPTLSTLVVWPVLDAARSLNVELDPERFGLSRDTLADVSQRVCHADADRLLRDAVERSGRPDFGLLVAQAIRPGHFGLLELLSHAQATIGESLARLREFMVLMCDGFELRMERGSKLSSLRVRVHQSLQLHPASFDMLPAFLYLIVREQTPAYEPTYSSIEFPYPRPDDPSYLETFFQCPAGFDAEEMTMHFETRYLGLPMHRASPEVRAVLHQAALALLHRMREPQTFVNGVRRAMRSGIEHDAATAPQIAASMHLAERTLRRRLHDAGTSFQRILDEVRLELAHELLEQPELSTDEIAERLQFSTPQAFHRAFRRWTGSTLRAVRERATVREGARAQRSTKTPNV